MGFIYTSNASGSFEIWQAIGETHTQLTNDGDADKWWPRYSAESNKILFYSSDLSRDINDYSKASLWVMNTDGSEARELIPLGAFDWKLQGMAEWSFDGNKIVMCAVDPEIGTWQIYITDADGTMPKRISTRDEVDYLDPIFDHEAQQLYCITTPEGAELTDRNYEVFRIDIETGMEERLTNNDRRDNHPHLSPDGKTIVYESLVDPNYLSIGKWALMSLDLSTAAEKELLNDNHINLFPRFSVSGSDLYYTRMNIETVMMSVARLHMADSSTELIVDDAFQSLNADAF